MSTIKTAEMMQFQSRHAPGIDLFSQKQTFMNKRLEKKNAFTPLVL
jgi:hypothetical protein